MKFVEKLSYAIGIYDNGKSSTIGFYKVLGDDLGGLFPAIKDFNEGAGKQLNIEVQDPMPWGDARQHTWKAIVDNNLHRDDFAYAHLAPDGANMTDAEMIDYWVDSGAESAESAEFREGLLDQLTELATRLTAKALPLGHNNKWVKGPRYESDNGTGDYAMRDETIMCRGCSTVAFWCKHDKIWKVDQDRDVTRSVKASCAEEREAIVEDARSRVAISEIDEADGHPAAVANGATTTQADAPA